MLIYAIALAQAVPTPLSEIHQRDIGCVATIAIVATEQLKGGWPDQPDMTEPGKRWAVIVGQRVIDQTGQPREIVGMAMTEAARAQGVRNENIEARKGRIADCNAIMNLEFAAIDSAKVELPMPMKPK